MAYKIHVYPLGWIARLLDVLMVPVMYMLSGTFHEIPQKTHFWNNQKLHRHDVFPLDKTLMVHSVGAVSARSPWMFGIIPRFHIPLFGGWRDYIVLEPEGDYAHEWYVGWSTDGVMGVSRIPVRGSVRLLRGPGEVSFFGIDSSSSKQIALKLVGFGHIGDGSHFARLPLH